MTVHDPAAIQRRLEQVLLQKLPPDAVAYGTRLLSRLRGPVNIVLIGRAGAGKTCLADLLALQFDLPACRYSELNPDDDPAVLRAAMTQADIVLWCSQEFAATELALWTKMPDVVKDHSFLILTKADLLVAQGRLQAALHSLGPIAAEEFHSLFPLATLQAIPAVGPQYGAAFRASGAAALKTALQHQLVLDRRATRDSAGLFVDRYGSADAVIVVAAVPSFKSNWAVSFAYLTERAPLLRDAITLPPLEKIRVILDHCTDTAAGLAALLDQGSPILDNDLTCAQEILSVADTMILLGLEGSASAATDALALLLQLRRDLSVYLNS